MVRGVDAAQITEGGGEGVEREKKRSFLRGNHESDNHRGAPGALACYRRFERMREPRGEERTQEVSR